MFQRPEDALQKRVYLDHNATTPPSDLIKNHWADFLNLYGNPSSIHNESRKPKTILRETRKKIAQLLDCSSLEIIFNSGASEGNSTILRTVYEAKRKERNEFIVSSVEHPSVTKTLQYLQSCGAVVHFVPVNREGVIDLNFIKSKLSDKTALVSVMFANNETGVVHPIKEISELAHGFGALMHSDCVQLLGKAKINFKSLQLDYATFSAHKFYGLKGTGFCYVKSTSPWQPLIFGSQERARRGGTENIIGLAALDLVLSDLANCEEKILHMEKLRNYFETELCQKLDGVRVTAASSQRLSNTSSLLINGIDGETLLMSLDLKGFSVSTGAACSSGSPEPSPVLLAMGLSRQEAQCSLRVSLGWSTTQKQIESFIQCLTETVLKLRSLESLQEANDNVGF